MIFRAHSYQQHCIDRLIAEDKLGLFLDMGLGKTAITLTAIAELKYYRFEITKALVVAPKKVAEGTWQKEAAKWEHTQKLRVSTVLGTSKQRLRALSTPADVYVINRDNVVWLVEHYRNDWPFDMVVLDELSSFKNPAAKRFKALTWVRKHMTKVVGLTGTPAPNGLIDLWSQIYLLDEGERLGKKVTHFRERYFDYNPYSHQYKMKDGSDGTIRQLIGDICISMKSQDYIELPDCITVDVPVTLDDKSRRAYEQLERDTLLQVDESLIDAGSAGILTNKLLQLSNGAVYDENRKVVEVHSCKIDMFLEVVEALQGKPALVFYNFQHDLERLIAALGKTKLRVRQLKDSKDEDDWNAHKVDILLAHPASCAYGLNLQQGGNHIIWFSLNWSLELYQQANKRLHRQGQAEKVIIHRLVTEGSRDLDVVAALENKGATQDDLMESLKARIRKAKGVIEP